MIYLDNGLKIGLVVLELLRSSDFEEALEGINISVGTFTNCRENGLTFTVQNKKGSFFTFCIYEHRNTDKIIINGKKGYINRNGELPYKTDSAGSWLADVSFGQYDECAKKLADLITGFYNQ